MVMAERTDGQGPMKGESIKLLGIQESEYRKFLPEYLEKQVKSLMDLFRRYNDLLPSLYRQNPADFDSHEAQYLSFLVDRNRRATEIGNPDYEQIAEHANSLLPAETLMVLCMDGRVKLIHVAGFSAGVGSSIRTAGGLLEGFEESDGELSLRDDAPLARLIDKKLGDDDPKAIAEIFDSHWRCAARIAEEEATGNSTGSSHQDAGLYRDVQYKKRMIQAIKDYIERKHPKARKEIIFAQTTFNPVTGYMYMGLDTDAALRYAERKSKDRKYAEFTKEVLMDLVKQGKIISTGDLISDPKIREIFDNHLFEADWRKRYAGTAYNFWSNMEHLKKEILPEFKDKVLEIYPKLGEPGGSNEKELDERAMVLLCNAYNTYLHNPKHDEMRYLQMEDEEYEKEEHYPYGIHNEEGVKVSEGGHPPYDITMFVTYPGEPDSVETAARIVRKNRREGRVKDILGRYKDDPEGFAKSPVSVVVQEIVRESDKVTEKQWEELRDIDWSDLTPDWEKQSADDFRDYLLEKGITSGIILKHIEDLRQKMIGMYSHKALGKHLRQLFKTAMPGICDKDRNFQAIIPFVKVGRAKLKKAA